MGIAFRTLPALALGSALAGCSVQQFVINKAGDALAGDSTVIARDDDPELVRAAVPFSLKLMESLLAKSPRHEGLLLGAASGFTQYGYGYVQLDADMAESEDFAASQRLRERARRLYLRARDYGLRGLEVRHAGITAALQRDPVAAVQPLAAKDVPLIYWTAASWGAAVSQAKDNPDLIGDLRAVDALVARAEALDPDYNAGALQSLLISYEMARGGRAEVARAHFARAIADGGGRMAGPYVSLAESVCVPQRARGEFLQRLQQALAIDPDHDPDHRLENLLLQRRARWLLGRVDDLFLPEPESTLPENAP